MQGDREMLNPIGEVYGRLTVLREVDRVNPRRRQFLCRCECGNETSLQLNKLRTGHTRSCGCLHVETSLLNLANAPREGRRVHGMRQHPLYQTWLSMKQRCLNPRHKDWNNYGGRGVTVCQRWQESFATFVEDVGERPAGHSLDRFPDKDGPYEPGNVRWATQQTQTENTRVVRMVCLDGRTQSISAWEREKGLSKGQVRSREAAGWSLEEAILTPSTPGQKRHARVKRDYSSRTRGSHGRYQPESAAALAPGAELPAN